MTGRCSNRRMALLAWGVAATPVVAQVFTSEFFSDPVTEGWEQLIYFCAETWNEDGLYFQQLAPCPPGPGGGTRRVPSLAGAL